MPGRHQATAVPAPTVDAHFTQAVIRGVSDAMPRVAPIRDRHTRERRVSRMSEQTSASGESVERGAAEDASGSPLTETEVESSTRPPSQPEPVGESESSGPQS